MKGILVEYVVADTDMFELSALIAQFSSLHQSWA